MRGSSFVSVPMQHVPQPTHRTHAHYHVGMEIDDETCKEFQTLYEREFGVSLSDDEAREMGAQVLAIYLRLAGPIRGRAERAERDGSEDTCG